MFRRCSCKSISERVKPDYVVIGEASQLNLKIGQRGRGEIVLETFGKPCHSANVVKTTVFIKDMNDFPRINKVYEKFFTESYPARSCVEVARLPKDALVEIEVVATK